MTRRASALRSHTATPSTSSSRALTPVPKTIDSSPIFEDEIIRTFMQYFLPSNVSERSSSSQQWLYQAVAQAQKDTALHLALGALSLARVGHIQKDKQLITQGQTVYCRALPALQRALYDQRFMWDETILAAGRTLEKYEVSQLTFKYGFEMLTSLIVLGRKRGLSHWLPKPSCRHDASCRTKRYRSILDTS